MGTNCSRALPPRLEQPWQEDKDMGLRLSKLPNTEVSRTMASKNVVPIGVPRKPSVSSLPSQISSIQQAPSLSKQNRSHSMPSSLSESTCIKRSHSLSIAAFSETESYVCSSAVHTDSTDDAMYEPVSLVDLCLRTLCHYIRDWVDEEGNPRMNFQSLPAELSSKLFELVRNHKLLREDNLVSFKNCIVPKAHLEQYPGLQDSWVPVLATLSNLRSINLSHCRLVTDDGFRHLAALGYGSACLEYLAVESCSGLTDASVALVVHSLKGSLLHLNLSGCARITDASLARIVQCRKLRTLSLSRCQLLSAAYLCQLGLLTRLQHLDLSLIPSVDALVFASLRPTRTHGAPFILSALEAVYGFPSTGGMYGPFVVHEPRCYDKRHADGVSLNPGFDFDYEGEDMDDDDDVEVESMGQDRDNVASFLLEDDDAGMEDELVHSLFEQEMMDENSSHQANQFARRSASRMKSVLRPLSRTSAKSQESSSASRKRSLFYRSRQRSLGVKKMDGVVPQSLSPLSTGKNTSLRLVPLRGVGEISRNRVSAELTGLRLQFACVQESGLRRLETLNASYCNVNDMACAHIASFRRLRILNVSQNPLTGKGMHSLATLQHLETLEASFCDRIEDGGSSIVSLPVLRHVNVACSSLSRFDCSSGMTNLVSLNLGCTAVNDFTLASLPKGAPQLEELDLEMVRVSVRGMEYVSHLKELRVLNLSDTNLRDDALKFLTNLTQLRKLNLFQCGLSAGLAELLFKSLVHLEWLNLDIVDMSEPCLRALRRLRQLRHLDLFGAKVTDRGCLEISKAGLVSLETLIICGGFVTDVGVSYLSTMKAPLRRLSLSQNVQITDQGVKRLAEAFGLHLKSLSLSSTSLSRRSITLFYSFVFLEELVVRGCGLPNIELHQLRQALPNLWHVLS